MTKYQLIIGGYGCEVCWYKLTEKQYNYWSAVDKEVFERYLFGRGEFDDEYDNNMINNIPDYADLRENGQIEWYELNNAGSEYYCTLDNSWIHVRLLNEKNNNNVDILVSRDLKELKNICENSENVEESREDIIVYDDSNEYISHPYVLQIVSYEKGTFIDSIIEIDDNNNEAFDIKKLRIHVSEALNESDSRIGIIEYNGIEIDNYGSNTRNKGFDIFLHEF